ncbi:MAG: S1/P1 nuclease [Xanthomonadales bacterium]|nr:S1/P1 nuclease [Xanthomonadales bacterium]
MRGVARLGTVLLACTLAWPVQAWGPLGHAIIAQLAQRQLGADAHAEVLRLLAATHAESLAAVSSWADAIQDDPAERALWQRTRRQHYVDFRDPTCEFEPALDCRGGQCVVAGIEHYVAVLADRSQSDAARAEALKFVVHFVGDIHQPLHAGYRDDRGGNTWQVRFDGRGSNLHRVWDSGLLASRGLAAPAYARLLEAQPEAQPQAVAGADAAAYARWAEESCRITAGPGFYPQTRRIGAGYVRAERPVAEQRLRLAGRRLAAILDAALVNDMPRRYQHPPSGRLRSHRPSS